MPDQIHIDEKLTFHPDLPMGIDVRLPAFSKRVYRLYRRLQLAAPEHFDVDRFRMVITVRRTDDAIVILPQDKAWYHSAIVERAVREVIVYKGWTFTVGLVPTSSGESKQVWQVVNTVGLVTGEGNNIVFAFLKATNK